MQCIILLYILTFFHEQLTPIIFMFVTVTSNVDILPLSCLQTIVDVHFPRCCIFGQVTQQWTIEAG